MEESKGEMLTQRPRIDPTNSDLVVDNDGTTAQTPTNEARYVDSMVGSRPESYDTQQEEWNSIV